ncbi:hypothetical protein CIG66_06995 [Ralstonia pseudosolanacearum]|nr:hypothetical protein CIG66_06995 [Ralstonia pseudosolanacearum]
MTAALLPNAKAQFIDSTGKPLVGGKVYFYIPNTSTLKDTYQDSAQTILNTNPVVLDANGQAIIWGVGTYRQVVYDQYNNLIWDQITEDISNGGLGNFVDNVFVSGADFTPGVTAQLTLAANYGSADNIWVFFDGVWQGLDQIQSLVGKVLTFASPIPIGVNKVYVKGGTTTTIGTPSNGTVTDASVAPGAAIQGTKLTYTLPGAAGAVARTITSRLSDWVSLKDFGAKGDGVTDDTNAIQAALNWAASGGKLLRVPAGLYIMTAGVSVTLNNGTPINSGGLRLTMIGDGPGSTCFQYAGGASPTLFTFTGNYADRLLLEGFRVQHTDQAAVSSNGIGISLVGQVNTVMRDVNFFRMTTGVSATDINSCEFNNCVFNYNSKGFTAAIGSVTYPNAIAFRNCYFSSNYQYGAAVTSGVTCTFDGCTFEANGLDNSGVVQPSAAALAFSNNGANGAASLRVLGCYFEHNAGAADIYVTHTATGTYVLQGNTFNRIDSVQYVVNDVVFDASSLGAGVSACKVELSGNGFLRSGTYSANSSHRYINYASGANFDQFYVDDDGTNNYQDSIELPIMDATRVSQYGAVSQVQARAYVTVSGGVATMQNNTGIVSVTRAGAGVFNVSLKRTAGSLALPQVQLGTGSMGWFYTNLTNTGFTINTYNAAGAPTDPASFILTVDAGT